MKYSYQLVITYANGKEEIYLNSKGKILNIDEFTSNFVNEEDILNYLEEEKGRKVSSIKINYQYEKQNVQTKKNLPILYNTDLFIESSVEDLFLKYLKSNKKEQRKFIAMLYPVINDGNHDNLLEEVKKELTTEVEKYFKNASYRKYRDAYFTLKNSGIKVRCKASKEKEIKKEKQDMEKHLSNFYSDFEDINHALETKDMDEVFAVCDLDDLHKIKSYVKELSIVDGASKSKDIEMPIQSEQITFFDSLGKKHK